MKIGMNLLLWTTHVQPKHDSKLEKLKHEGFDGVEIPVFEGDEKNYQKLGNKLRAIGLGCTAVTVLSGDTNPISPNSTIRKNALKRLKWAISCSAEAGAETLCGPLHSALGQFTGNPPTESEKKWGADVLREAAEFAAERKVTLALEYLNRFESYFLTTAKDSIELLNKVNHPSCGMMYDTFHAHIEESSITPVLNSIRKKLVHFHISECHRGIPGTGMVHWEETFNTLKKIGYDRWIVIEAFSRALPELAAATRVWRDLCPDIEKLPSQGLRFIRKGLKLPTR